MRIPTPVTRETATSVILGSTLLLVLLWALFQPMASPASIRASGFLIETDSNGEAEVFTEFESGAVLYIQYAGGFDAGVDFSITCDLTGELIWAETDVSNPKIVAPRKRLQDVNGDDLGPPGQSNTIFGAIWCINSRVRIVVSGGGDTMTALFRAAVGGGG